MHKITRGICNDILRGLSEKQDEFKSSKLIDLAPLAETINIDRETLSCALTMLEEDELILNGSCETSVCALIRRKGWQYLKELDRDGDNDREAEYRTAEAEDAVIKYASKQQIDIYLDLRKAQLA